MLATTQRLRRSSDFAAVVRGGRRAGRGNVVVHLSMPTRPAADPVAAVRQVPDQPAAAPHRLAEPAPAGSSDSPARAGFVVSKAVGNAVVRNAVRRRLRHLVRDRLAQLPAGAMLVVRALPGAAGAASAELGADLDAALAVARNSRRGRQAGAGVMR